MELRDIELLDNRIRIAFREGSGNGCKIHLSRNETLLILGFLDEEIGKRRQEVPTPEKRGMSYEEFLARREKK